MGRPALIPYPLRVQTTAQRYNVVHAARVVDRRGHLALACGLTAKGIRQYPDFTKVTCRLCQAYLAREGRGETDV